MIGETNGTYESHLRDAVRRYFDRGWVPVPARFATKKPTAEKWEQSRLAGLDLDALFPGGVRLNVGLLNGSPSGGLVDIDLDCLEVRAAAPHLLPPTDMIWGRRSAPGSHCGYVVADPPGDAAKNYDDPAGGHLFEVRSTGGFTILPPSVAPADPDQGKVEEPVVWLRDGDPASVNMADLRRAVHRVAAAAVLARHWPTGRRHAAALAVAGGLLRAGWPVADVEVFLTAVCDAAGDPEVNDRVRAAADTAANLESGDKATGWPVLAQLLGSVGDAVVTRIRDWLGVTMVRTPTSSSPARGPDRYRPLPAFRPFPTDCLPRPWADFVRQGATA